MTPETIGPYPIERELGRGGMGVVYLGRDTKLDRRVAIKVLPDVFAVDPERSARFEREARLVASLNHPNIAGIHGIEESNGHRFLVLEYVDGETLAERLARGALTLDETLDVCRQVAAALEAAHEGGVVHRDLKPANIKVTTAGEVKVLDFGLAKSGAGTSADSLPDLSNSPTLTRGMTAAGVILGTAAYMSPEQSRGKPVDKRTDIWAFGCLLYECLTGRQAFAGETVSDMIARILQGEPEWNALPARTPERIRGLMRRCLEKDSRRRLRDIGDARMELEDVQAVHASSSAVSAGAATPADAQSRRLLEWGRLTLVALVAAGLGWFVPKAMQPPVRPEPVRFTVPEPEGGFLWPDGGLSSLSPDGRTLAFAATDSVRVSQIWLRDLESTEARRLAGTEGTVLPFFWSPDSREIAFTSQNKLKRISVDGGGAETVCDVKALRGGSWNRDGVLLVAPFANGAIYRVSAVGGDLTPVTVVDTTRGETAHRFPRFLPDGEHFFYSVLPARDGKHDTYIGSLRSPDRQLLLSADTGVTWSGTGHILYSRDGRLIAQGFDADSRKLRGEPFSLGDAVAPTDFSGGPSVSASLAGRLAYCTPRLTNQRLAWVDYDGVERVRVPLAPGPYASPSLSPDNRRVALERLESTEMSDVWIADLERGVATRFTDEPGSNTSPRWSPDGSRVAYLWSHRSAQRIIVKTLVGETAVTFLDSDPLFKNLYGWTPDGQNLIYGRLDPQTQWDIWILPVNGNGEPRPYLRSRFNELQARVSPDGRWVAYNSNESGQVEAYVQSFPVPGGKYKVTNGGGTSFGWSSDGKQLLFGLDSDRTHLYAADVLDGAEFRLGPPRIEITLPKEIRGQARAQSDRRALMLLPAGNDPPRSLTIVLDGLPGASKR